MWLPEMLHTEHRHVRTFKGALDVVEQHPQQEKKIIIHLNKTPAGEYARRFNAQETNQVAAIVGEERDRRDIIVREERRTPPY